MSRYNHWRYEVARPLRDLVFSVVAGFVLGFFAIMAIIYDVETAMDRCDRLVCRLTEHRWADESKWGVEAVCLNCGIRRTRGVSSSERLWDKFPRLVFLGSSGAFALFSGWLATRGERTAAAIGVGGGLLLWCCWAILFWFARIRYPEGSTEVDDGDA